MLNKEEIEIQRFTDEEIKIVKGYIKERLKRKDWDNKAFYITMNAYTLVKHIENIESDKQKLIEKLEEESKQLENDILTMSTDTGNKYSLKLIHQAEGMKKQNDRILGMLKN